jgi:hypothetical protein
MIRKLILLTPLLAMLAVLAAFGAMAFGQATHPTTQPTASPLAPDFIVGVFMQPAAPPPSGAPGASTPRSSGSRRRTPTGCPRCPRRLAQGLA